MEYCKKYCNTDLQKSIAISIAIVFPPSIAIAIAILFASITNNPGNLSGAEFGQIWEKWPDYGFAEVEIRCNPNLHEYHCLRNSTLGLKVSLNTFNDC